MSRKKNFWNEYPGKMSYLCKTAIKSQPKKGMISDLYHFTTGKSQPVPRPNQFIRATQPTWSANRVTKKYISTTAMTKDLDRVKNLYEMTATLDVPQLR